MKQKPRRDPLIFKLWLWSIIGALAVFIVFWIVSGIFPAIEDPGSANGFVDGLLYSSVLGNVLGTGLVGWRFVEKYKPSQVQRFLKRYRNLNLLSFLIAIVLINTLLSPLMAVWSVVAPWIAVKILKELELVQ